MRVAVLRRIVMDKAFSFGLILSRIVLAKASVTLVNVCTVSSYALYLTQHRRDLALSALLLLLGALR